MINKSAPEVTVCLTYRLDEAVIGLAEELAAKHAHAVHVGRYVDEDTGETSPAFFFGNERASREKMRRSAAI